MGQVITVADNVVTVRGLSNVMVGEVVFVVYTYKTEAQTIAAGEVVGQALNLNNDGTTGIVLFGDETLILAGNLVFGTGRLLSVGVGASTLGKVVNALGQVELSGTNTTSICAAPGQYNQSALESKIIQFFNGAENITLLKQLGFDNVEQFTNSADTMGADLVEYFESQ